MPNQAVVPDLPPGTRPVLDVGIAATPREWRPELMSWISDHERGLRLRVLRDSDLALSADLDVIIVDDSSLVFNAATVRQLRHRGVIAVGLVESSAGQESPTAEMVSTGLSAVISYESSETFVEALYQSVGIDSRKPIAIEDPTQSDATPPPPAPGAIPTTPAGPTTATTIPTSHDGLIAVLSASSELSTEFAILLATCMADLDGTVLIDFDDVDPTIGWRLGLAPKPDTTSAFERLRENVFDPMHAAADRSSPGPEHPFWAIPADTQLRLDSVTGSEVSQLCEQLCQSFPHVVAATSIESVRTEARASRAVVAFAERVIFVAEPDPVGFMHAVEFANGWQQSELPGRLAVCFHGPESGSFERSELVANLRDIHGPDTIEIVATIPRTEKALAGMRWNGLHHQRRLKESKALRSLLNQWMDLPFPMRRGPFSKKVECH